MTRLVPLGAAAMVAVGGLAACAKASGTSSSVPVAQVDQRYQAAVGPANAALTTVFNLSLAYAGGSPKALDEAARRSEGTISDAVRQLGRINPPRELKGDIADVATALTAVAADLSALAAATGNDIEPSIARLVADAGRESAADGLARLAFTAAETPTSRPSLTIPPATDAPVATTTTTTTVETPSSVRRTTTTVAHHTTTTTATTTKAKTTTTVAHTPPT